MTNPQNPSPQPNAHGSKFPYTREVLEQALEYLALDGEASPDFIVENAFALVGKRIPAEGHLQQPTETREDDRQCDTPSIS